MKPNEYTAYTPVTPLRLKERIQEMAYRQTVSYVMIRT